MGRNIEQGAVLCGTFHFEVQTLHGIFPVMTDVFVELVVFLVSDVLFVLGPDGLHGVEGLLLGHPDGFVFFRPRGFAVLVQDLVLFYRFALGIQNRLIPFDIHDNRVRYEIGMLFDDTAYGPLLGKILFTVFLFTQFENDRRATSILFNFFDGVFTAAF